MKANDCIFCKIINGDVPSYKIHETNEYLAFLDISQFTEGHTLCIPKEHYEFIWDSPDIGEYFGFVKKVGEHFLEIGYTFADTLTMGRDVPHAHVHVIPHNGDSKGWNRALQGIGEHAVTATGELTEEKGMELVKRLAF
jgi:histidine triad (HIT) family protein